MANHTIATNVYVSFLEKKGFLSWFLTTDHKRIGILYLISISFFFLIAGTIALLMRFELLTPASDFVSPHTYNVLFTLHGSLMVFFFIVPGLAASFGKSAYLQCSLYSARLVNGIFLHRSRACGEFR